MFGKLWLNIILKQFCLIYCLYEMKFESLIKLKETTNPTEGAFLGAFMCLSVWLLVFSVEGGTFDGHHLHIDHIPSWTIPTANIMLTLSMRMRAYTQTYLYNHIHAEYADTQTSSARRHICGYLCMKCVVYSKRINVFRSFLRYAKRKGGFIEKSPREILVENRMILSQWFKEKRNRSDRHLE